MQLAPSKWSDPWLNGFPYRKPISIAGSTSTLTQFQVNVTPYIYNETGLVGSWHFSESSGNATDSSGFGNTGILYGANRTTNGKFGNAMSFDGVDDGVNVTPAITLSNTFTIEAWIKPGATGPDANPMIVSRSAGVSGTNEAYLLQYSYSNKGIGNCAFYSSSTIYSSGSTATNSILPESWTHVACVYNSTDLAIFVNGTIYISAPVAGAPTPNNIGDTYIGKYGGSANYDFNGTIDEVRIYNRALSASEIQTLYNATKARLDYADVRFTDSDGSTLLPFWMESDGKFWVRVPSIPTTGTTIYAYYGNPQANDAQNGTGTFEFFDDFNRADGAIGNQWTQVQGLVTVDANRAKFVGSGADPWAYRDGVNNNIVITNDFYTSSTSGTRLAGTLVRAPTSGAWVTGYGWLYSQSTSTLMIYDNSANVNSIGLTLPVNTWLTGEMIIKSNDNLEVRVWQKGNPKPASPTITYTTAPASTGTKHKMTMGGDSGALIGYSDNFYVRKYASPEPSAVNGTEEDSPIPQNITVPLGSATNWTWYPSS